MMYVNWRIFHLNINYDTDEVIPSMCNCSINQTAGQNVNSACIYAGECVWATPVDHQLPAENPILIAVFQKMISKLLPGPFY